MAGSAFALRRYTSCAFPITLLTFVGTSQSAVPEVVQTLCAGMQWIIVLQLTREVSGLKLPARWALTFNLPVLLGSVKEPVLLNGNQWIFTLQTVTNRVSAKAAFAFIVTDETLRVTSPVVSQVVVLSVMLWAPANSEHLLVNFSRFLDQ